MADTSDESDAITKQDHAAAVAFARNQMLDGMQGEAVANNLKEAYPEIDPAIAMAVVYESFEMLAGSDAAVLRGWCLDATRHVYEAALRADDTSVALRAVKQLYDLSKELPDEKNPELPTEGKQ